MLSSLHVFPFSFLFVLFYLPISIQFLSSFSRNSQSICISYCVCKSASAVCGGESDSQSEWTALISAALSGNAECVRPLIDAGADTNVKDMVGRRSLLNNSTFSFLTAFS